MTDSMKWGLIAIVGFIAFVAVLGTADYFDNKQDHEDMQTCLAQPGHSWVRDGWTDYYECVPDSEVSR